MKRLHILFTLLAALIFGSATAWADIVENYTMGFNDEISTTDHEFKPAPGWGHVSHYYTFGGYWGEKVYPTYTYCPTDGIGGSGALKVGTQTKVTHPDYYGTGTTSDVLVTPKLTGASSIYVKKVSDDGTVKLFNVTYNASTKKYTKGSQITDFTLPELSTTEWTKVELPTADGVYYGICASDVYIDDFSAESADIVLNKELKITKLTMKSGGNPDCDADNNVGFSFEVTLKNTGDINYAPGDENYSLSLRNYSNSNAVMATTAISEALNVGEEKMVTFEGTYPLSALLYADKVTRARIDVYENISNTFSYGGWIEPTPYKPVMVIRKDKSRQDNGVAYAWGKANSASGKTFTIENAGAAPLNITSISVPEGFSVDTEVPQAIAAHQSVEMNITFNPTQPGEYSGDVVIAGDDVDNFTIKVSGTMLDPEKYYINFEDGKIPAGSYTENSDWSIAETGLSGSGNAYFLKNNRTNADSKFVTPLLSVGEGEKLTLDAARCYYSSDYETSYLNVYYSDNRTDWTLAKKITSAEMLGEREGVSGHYEGKLTSFEIDNIPAGNHYLAFGAGYVCLDNIYGFKLVDVAHDWKLGESKIAPNGFVNNPYKASVSLQNLNTKNEAADSYSATLYMNDVAVATAPAAEIEAGGSNTYEFDLTPHEAGTFQTHVVFKSLTDDYELATSDVEVSISEEVASKDVPVGTAGTTTSYSPFNWYNTDNGLGAQCDLLYKAELLAESGLKAGDKITSVKYTGTAATAGQYKELTATAYVGAVTEEGYTPSENVDGMQQVDIYEGVPLTFATGDVLETVIQLPQPIVWDGVSAIRVYTHVKDAQKKYARINYNADSRYSTAYYKNGSSLSFSSTTKLPVAEFGIKTDPMTISGTVTSKGEPVADAKVTLTNNDVLYTGKSDAEGKYSFSVIQTDKKYKLTATAEKYVDYEEADSIAFTENVVKDIVLQKVTVKLSGVVTYRKDGVAGAIVTLTHADDAVSVTTDEQGAFAFDAVEPDLAYKLSVKAETFNDYATEEDITITEPTQLEAIELTKKPVSVSGKVVYRTAGLSGATVTLSRGEQSLNATTDEEGKYEFAEVVPDNNYALSVKAEKFNDYATADSIEVKEAKSLDDIAMTRKPVSVSGKVVYREAGVAGAAVTLSRGEQSLSATTDEEGKYEFTEVVPDYNYALSVKAERFIDYATADSIEVNDDKTVDDIVLVKPNVKITGMVKWCDTPMEGITLTCTDNDNATTTATTDAAGAYEFVEINPEKRYVISITDADGNFEPFESDVIESDEDVVKDIELVAVPVKVTIDNSGYAAFSCAKAVDFSKANGLKAYVVAELGNGYTVLKEITEAPANTGVILEAASGEYDITPVISAAEIEKNMLVATSAEAFTITDATVGKAWALDSSDGMTVFTSKAGTTVAKGSAYLAAEYNWNVIYLSEANGINSASAFTNGNLDVNKPMYNMAGQRVGKHYKGVIIQNGKKYTVK